MTQPVPDIDAAPYALLRKMAHEAPGSRLPTERELAEQLNIPRARVRALLATLEEQGLVYRRQGSGTYAIDLRSVPLHTIALLIDQQLKLGEDPFFSLVVEQLQEAIQGDGLRCTIARIGGEHHPWGIGDGMVTVGLAGSELVDDWHIGHPPLVSLFLDKVARGGTRVSIFQLDDRMAGRMAALDVIGQGCQRVMFVGNQAVPASQERFRGVEAVAAERQIPLVMHPCHLNYLAGLMVGQDLAQSDDLTATGIIAANDWLALGIRAGVGTWSGTSHIAIPITSFDGLAMTADARLHIHSLAVPIQSIAHDAISELRRLATIPQAVGRTVQYQLQWQE